MVIEQVVRWGRTHPKKLFQIDGLGAILSAVLLGIVLVKFEKFFGIPQSTLYLLASLPCLFALYDLYCYFKINQNLGSFLRAIATANLLYGGLSLGLAVYHSNEITYWGWSYILIEILIVVTLATLELQIANNHLSP